MKLVLCHESALELYRLGFSRGMPVSLEGEELVTTRAQARRLDDSALLSKLSRPLHVLTLSACERSSTRELRPHVLTAVPAGSILWTGEKDIYVTSPELSLLQLAGPPYARPSIEDLALYDGLPSSDPLRPLVNPRERSRVERLIGLLGICMELTGSYRRMPTRYGRERLTSYNELSHFADAATGMRGIMRFRQALRYEIDLSLSPMETGLALMLSLPSEMGGFGLPKPLLNVRLLGSMLNGDVSSQREMLPDLYWPEEEVIIEYDSDEFHGAALGKVRISEHEGTETRRQNGSLDARLLHDAERANSLVATGHRVLSVRSGQVMDLERLELLARQVACLLGRDLPTTDAAGSVMRKVAWRALFFS